MDVILNNRITKLILNKPYMTNKKSFVNIFSRILTRVFQNYKKKIITSMSQKFEFGSQKNLSLTHNNYVIMLGVKN